MRKSRRQESSLADASGRAVEWDKRRAVPRGTENARDCASLVPPYKLFRRTTYITATLGAIRWYPRMFGDGGLLLALGMAATCFFLMRRTARRISQQRRKAANAPPAAVVDSSGSLRHKDAAKCEVELYDLARDLQGELETKARVLQILVTQAREEAERLERLLAAEEGPATPADDDREFASEPVRFAPDVGVAPHPRPRRASIPDRAEEVYRRSEAGEAAAAIARTLSRPLADVELLLSLRGDR
jgi:hypothetical protein